MKRKLEAAKQAEYHKAHFAQKSSSVTEGNMDKRAKSTGREDHIVPPPFVSTMEDNAPTNFTGVSVTDLLFVEIFAGTAKLSKQARDTGFRVLPIDKTSQRSSQIYIAQYDLTEPDQFASLMQVLRSEQHRIAAFLHLCHQIHQSK